MQALPLLLWRVACVYSKMSNLSILVLVFLYNFVKCGSLWTCSQMLELAQIPVRVIGSTPPCLTFRSYTAYLIYMSYQTTKAFFSWNLFSYDLYFQEIIRWKLSSPIIERSRAQFSPGELNTLGYHYSKFRTAKPYGSYIISPNSIIGIN